MNAYVTLDILKSGAVLDIAGSEDDGRLLMLLESVSRQVDAYCNRHFFTLRGEMVFDGGRLERAANPGPGIGGYGRPGYGRGR